MNQIMEAVGNIAVQQFSAIDETAGNLLIPYLLWVTFAGYLNFGVFLLN